jgi:hypothetical protein
VILKDSGERNGSTKKSAAKYLICSYQFKFEGHMNDLLSKAWHVVKGMLCLIL